MTTPDDIRQWEIDHGLRPPDTPAPPVERRPVTPSNRERLEDVGEERLSEIGILARRAPQDVLNLLVAGGPRREGIGESALNIGKLILAGGEAGAAKFLGAPMSIPFNATEEDIQRAKDMSFTERLGRQQELHPVDRIISEGALDPLNIVPGLGLIPGPGAIRRAVAALRATREIPSAQLALPPGSGRTAEGAIIAPGDVPVVRTAPVAAEHSLVLVTPQKPLGEKIIFRSKRDLNRAALELGQRSEVRILPGDTTPTAVRNAAESVQQRPVSGVQTTAPVTRGGVRIVEPRATQRQFPRGIDPEDLDGMRRKLRSLEHEIRTTQPGPRPNSPVNQRVRALQSQANALRANIDELTLPQLPNELEIPGVIRREPITRIVPSSQRALPLPIIRPSLSDEIPPGVIRKEFPRQGVPFEARTPQEAVQLRAQIRAPIRELPVDRPLAAQVGIGALTPGGILAAGRGIARGGARAAPRVSSQLQNLPAASRDATRKLTDLLNQAVPLRADVETLRTEELGRRVGQASDILGQGDARGAFQRARAPLRGDLPAPGQFTPPGEQLTGEEVVPLFDRIRDSDKLFFQRLNTSDALEKVLLGQVPTRSEIVLLEDMFGPELSKAILRHRPLREKVFENAVDALNLPRTVMTAWDASAPLRQGIVLAPSHPIRFTKNIATMFKALAREGSAEAVDQAIRLDPNFARFTGRHDGSDLRNLFIADRTGVGTGLAGREEQFMSRFARFIPGIRQSERAYVTFLNKFRFDVMSDIVKKWEKSGTPVGANDLDELAKFINRATGRGGLGRLEDMAPILNAGFFSPRFVSSRISLPLSALSSSPRVRKLAAQELVTFVASGITALSLLSFIPGVDVQIDPRSSDFGKIRIGKTRLDFWGGFQPIARYTAQLATNQRRDIRSDQVVPVRGRGDTVLRFLRSKAGPPTSLVIDSPVFTGRDFIGTPFGAPGELFGKPIPGPLREIGKRTIPLFVQDMAEAIDEDGWLGGFKALPAFLGASAQTFDETSGRETGPIPRPSQQDIQRFQESIGR